MASSSFALNMVSSSSSFFFKFHNPEARSVSLIPSGIARRRSFNYSAPFNNDVHFPGSAMATSSLSLKRVSSSNFFFKSLNPEARSISLIPSGAVPRCSFNNSAPLDNDDFSESADCSESEKEEVLITSRESVAIKKLEGYELREDFENMYLIFELPAGFEKEDVKISMEADVMTVEGVVVNESREDGFLLKLNICSSLYHHHKIKARFKNRVLEIVFPKVN